MDYENLYKNALERAKKFIEENPLVQNLNTWIKETFPELKEPEDEKVRKALIEMVHDTPNSECEQNYNVRKEEALAWLEKQSEQKPTIEMKSAEESLGIDSDTYNEIVDECIYGEQKYWSEEDEKMVDNILTPLATKCPFEIYQPMYNWLKSLKQRIGGLTDFDVIGEVVQRNLLEEVVKQMSDTLLVETLLYRKKQGTLSIFYGERKEGLERFLKSICTWKPSDEQMATLYKYAEQNNYDGSILTSLYNDLKKLREE